MSKIKTFLVAQLFCSIGLQYLKKIVFRCEKKSGKKRQKKRNWEKETKFKFRNRGKIYEIYTPIFYSFDSLPGKFCHKQGSCRARWSAVCPLYSAFTNQIGITRELASNHVFSKLFMADAPIYKIPKVSFTPSQSTFGTPGHKLFYFVFPFIKKTPYKPQIKIFGTIFQIKFYFINYRLYIIIFGRNF